MINIPDNFPSYTSYNAKTLLLHVDSLKAAIKELQADVFLLKAKANSSVTITTEPATETVMKPSKKTPSV